LKWKAERGGVKGSQGLQGFLLENLTGVSNSHGEVSKQKQNMVRFTLKSFWDYHRERTEKDKMEQGGPGEGWSGGMREKTGL
jgi:hypothetical protein